MAGFIFSIGAGFFKEGVKTCIKNGVFAAKLPSAMDSSMARQVSAGVLCDYISMQPGDNVYFLTQRKIYGVGKLIKIGDSGSCITKNYPSAHILDTINEIPLGETGIIEGPPEFRWVCYFEPEGQFFETGVDMDDVLLYRPHAFRMLRAFQDRSFIKIDDEENRALKEYIYLANKSEGKIFEFNSDFHMRAQSFDLSDYEVTASDTISLMRSPATGEVALEMLVEAAVLEELKKENGAFGKWDYISHQVIASPFKPISYIDKIDVFAYRFLAAYPGEDKPIEKYLIFELKKGKANRATVLQAMRYVDWVCKEYAAGDYSRVEAKIVAHSYTRNILKETEDDRTRHFISTTHPIVSASWNELKLYSYAVSDDGYIEFTEQQQ